MKKLPLCFLLILLQIIVSVHSQNPALLKFVLQWPPTFCIQLNSATTPGRCKEPIPQHEFTLHGLWPANAQGYSLSCPNQPDPNWNQVFTTPIENQLTTFWPSLRENSQKRDIWKHEWRVHGVCGGTTAQVYFNTAIRINNMIQKGNLFNYLKTSGIIACDSLAFPRRDIVAAIQKVFGNSALNVYTSCIQANRTHLYLNEVTLCTNVAGTSFISCPAPAGSTTCSTGAPIMLPHPQRQSVMLQEETNGIYHTVERSWAKYAFNRWD